MQVLQVPLEDLCPFAAGSFVTSQPTLATLGRRSSLSKNRSLAGRPGMRGAADRALLPCFEVCSESVVSYLPTKKRPDASQARSSGTHMHREHVVPVRIQRPREQESPGDLVKYGRGRVGSEWRVSVPEAYWVVVVRLPDSHSHLSHPVPSGERAVGKEQCRQCRVPYKPGWPG